MAAAEANWMATYNGMVETYATESDRAAAVLGASFIDARLQEMLHQYMVAEQTVADLFSGDRPLATFSARISLAYALGLLPLNIREDLDRIRRIRNHFAHHPDAVSFSVSPARDLCRTLAAIRSDPLKTPIAERWPPRRQFLVTLAAVSYHLSSVSEAIRNGSIRKCAVPQPFRMVFNEDTSDPRGAA